MRVIVTGGAGFIGSHLVDKLIAQGDEVIVIDDFSTGKESNVHPKAKIWRKKDGIGEGDIGTFFIQGSDVPKAPIDVVFHLAALARIQPSFKDPWGTYDANSTGTIVALEIAKKYKSRFVFAGSSSVYYDTFANPYSYTKWIGEQHYKLYNKLYDVPVAIARFFNVYGPRQIEKGNMATVIGIFERQLREGKPLTVTGDGKKRRDFTHVDDIVNGLIAMSKEDWYAAVFDLGTTQNYSILEVAEMFKSKIEFIPERPGEAQTTRADIKFSKKMLGWKPIVKLPDYIEKIVNKDQ